MAKKASSALARRALLIEKYAALLPPVQRKYVEQRYFLDLTLGEIAARNGVSRYAIQDGLKRAVSLLESADKALRLVERHRKIEKLAGKIADPALARQITDLL